MMMNKQELMYLLGTSNTLSITVNSYKQFYFSQYWN